MISDLESQYNLGEGAEKINSEKLIKPRKRRSPFTRHTRY